MSNRPYKNVKRFADGVSKEIKKEMHKEQEQTQQENENPKDNSGKTNE